MTITAEKLDAAILAARERATANVQKLLEGNYDEVDTSLEKAMLASEKAMETIMLGAAVWRQDPMRLARAVASVFLEVGIKVAMTEVELGELERMVGE